MNINDIMRDPERRKHPLSTITSGKIMRQLLMRVIWGFVVKPFRLIL